MTLLKSDKCIWSCMIAVCCTMLTWHTCVLLTSVIFTVYSSTFSCGDSSHFSGCYMNAITSYFLCPQTSSSYSQISMLSYLTRWVSRGASQALKGASSQPQLVKTPHIGNQTLAATPLPFTGGSPGARQARALDQERLLQIDWDDGSCSLYPFTWLRDNCQCPHCTLQSAQARSLLFSNLDVHIGMDQVQLMDNKVGFGQQSLKG